VVVVGVYNGVNIAPLSSKLSAFVFLLGIYATLPCSVPPPTIALPLDVILLLMQVVNLQIFFYEFMFKRKKKNQLIIYTSFVCFILVFVFLLYLYSY
jgi:hypothetical protein